MITTQVGFINDEESGRSSRYIVLDADGIQVARVRLIYLPGATETVFTWTAWHGNGWYHLDLYKINQKGTILGQQGINVNVADIPEELPTVPERFQAAYQQYFGLSLSSPAFAHFNQDNPEETKWNLWTSAVYLDDTLYKVYFYDESNITGTNAQSLSSGEYSVCQPRGNYKILLVIVDYGNTSITPDAATEKHIAAEQAANQRWVEYSSGLGLAEPILQTETTITYLAAPPVPGELVTAEQVRSLTGYDPSDFDILAEVDLDVAIRVPQKHGGGGVAFMGGCKPEGSQAVNMIVGISNRDDLTNMAAALYDHELIHLFGWVHSWPDGDGSGPAQLNEGHWFPFKLFGWTDTNDDGIIEILSDLPYGYQP
ncbi:MAG: hypothetical protein HY781_09355 [Chloroflexi bacterium]|nr:hypothetical protein [Chloroflexota bacterium]